MITEGKTEQVVRFHPRRLGHANLIESLASTPRRLRRVKITVDNRCASGGSLVSSSGSFQRPLASRDSRDR
jgi:hypothetical protein